MRLLPTSHIWDLWNAGGPFIGTDGAPHGRITVEPNWQLRKSSNHIGSFMSGPVRYFQRADNGQTETEVPNVKTIEIQKSFDQDAATCTIVMENQWMFQNGQIAPMDQELGQPGYFTFNRGESADATTRWGYTENSWNRILVPDALLRTYQGYGGKSKTINQALSDGNILQTGIWLVDEIQIGTNGEMTIKCRDVAKLLIDQGFYPPFIRSNIYKNFEYYRFLQKEVNKPAIAYGNAVYHTGYSPSYPTVVTSLSHADADHTDDNAVDQGDIDSYWLSGGYATNNTSTEMTWIQFDTNGDSVGGFNLYPWGGGYIIYVSIDAGGWQGTNTIPYTGPHSGVAIPYVKKINFGGWETPYLFTLPTEYSGVSHVRLTFARLAKSNLGPYYYRAGVRDFNYGTFTGTVSSGGKYINDIIRSSNDSDVGYALVGSDGGVFSFGDFRFWGSEAGKTHVGSIVGIAGNGSNTGYWLVGTDGGVYTFGDARFHGSVPGLSISISNAAGIERSPGGNGYYVFGLDGGVFSFGDATYHGNMLGDGLVVGMAVDPGGGYWLVNSAGKVTAHGTTFYGDAHSLSLAAPITGMAATPSGNGYYLVGQDGGVFTYGDAVYHGGTTGINLVDVIVSIEVEGDNSGYLLAARDGGVFAFGGARFEGSLPYTTDYLDNLDGNYKDYADIVKVFLLWAGWWFYPNMTSNFPDVFGNIESTGAFAPDVITKDYFDRKPIVDIINSFKEIVGYNAYADETGAFRFESPNVWQKQNIYEDGTVTKTFFPQIDEALQITDYRISFSDKDARSSIVISSSDPTFALNDTITTNYASITGSSILKGIVKPALWINGTFTDKTQQENMAKMIDLRLFLAERQGSVTMFANPAIQIGDQVRIWERQTSETYYHYVTGYSSSMNTETGEYTMTLTTHWLGDDDNWAISFT